MQLQAVSILKRTFGMREAVTVIDTSADAVDKIETRRRLSVIISTMLDDVADGIIGRQVGPFLISIYSTYHVCGI